MSKNYFFTKCRYCGAEIAMVKLRSGEYMPCEERLTRYRRDKSARTFVVTEQGETVRAEVDIPGNEIVDYGWVPHFKQCVRYQEYLRYKESREPKRIPKDKPEQKAERARKSDSLEGQTRL